MVRPYSTRAMLLQEGNTHIHIRNDESEYKSAFAAKQMHRSTGKPTNSDAPDHCVDYQAQNSEAKTHTHALTYSLTHALSHTHLATLTYTNLDSNRS